MQLSDRKSHVKIPVCVHQKLSHLVILGTQFLGQQHRNGSKLWKIISIKTDFQVQQLYCDILQKQITIQNNTNNTQ